MARSKLAGRRSEVVYGFAKRADGSVRQMIVQEPDGKGGNRVIDMGYFAPGTTTDDAAEGRGKKYHWADAFTDAELAQHYELGAERIAAMRRESVTANAEQKFHHRSDAS